MKQIRESGRKRERERCNLFHVFNITIVKKKKKEEEEVEKKNKNKNKNKTNNNEGDEWGKSQYFLASTSYKAATVDHYFYYHLWNQRKNRTCYAHRCWENKDETSSDFRQWKLTLGHTVIGVPIRTYIDQLVEINGYPVEDMKTAMENKDIWRKRIAVIHTNQ
ncbi:Hypothetical predicted protein [Octopus vulgaris]|uniref:Uncharacterized protein n=1 Tax=Octopus vulgaris TaxID=6645 RepID=A0AA36FDX6_OCTVU|nr:Hypothetical predicted protein [Octopus vulgaris]